MLDYELIGFVGMISLGAGYVLFNSYGAYAVGASSLMIFLAIYERTITK